ncbi:MAG: SRPBCC domain-containing protein [Chitinophagaceae bacterium]
MEKLHFETDINAPAVAVFNAIIDKQKFEEWASVFNPTSTFEGGWEKGDKILFIGVNKEGKKEGMVSKIKENIPYKQISIQHLGFLDGDKEITEGPEIEKWANAMEEYFLEETNGKTKFKVAIDITEDFKDYMSGTWPKALEKLKEIAERA